MNEYRVLFCFCFNTGDPLCQWREGQPHPKAALISHPGVCEPVDSPRCTNQKWISCTGTKQKCPAINETGVREFDVRFPHTLVKHLSHFLQAFFCLLVLYFGKTCIEVDTPIIVYER